MTLKTNKEYQAKLFEIENMKADKSVLEDEILKFMELSDKVVQEITQEKGFLAEEEKKYLAEKAKVDVVIAELQDKASALEARRREALIGVDKAMVAVYDRVVENRGGTALVPVVGNACGGCFMHVPPQVINKIKMYDEIVRCEMCARFLYLQEEI
jgi:predicted  nucleic acid-binding Zn-ribbon protein